MLLLLLTRVVPSVLARTHIWTISPLDPAALDHNNARHLLCTNEGAEDRSALSLSVNFCLAIGTPSTTPPRVV